MTAHEMKKLLETLIRKEKHQKEREKKDSSKSYRPLSNVFGWFYYEAFAYNRQQKCRHLKGALGVPSPSGRDYNVAMHTFPTGETKIWCLSNCGWHVWNRSGWSFKWAHGLKMVEFSTNWPSSSQIMPEMLKGKRAVPVKTDVGGGARVVYHNKEKV